MAKTETPSFWISIRFLLAFLAFLGYLIQYTQKIDMSVAIVCMINNTAIKSQSHPSLTSLNETFSNETHIDKCYFKAGKGKGLDGSFAWSKGLQGFILAAYFYGYLITEIPGGMLSLKFGGKRVYLIAMLAGSIFTLLIPVSARLHYGALIACRFLIGLAHGVMWPAIASIWSLWAPPAERSRLIGFSNAGSQIGNVIALPLGGFLCINGFDGGWPSIFYIFGAVGILWSVAWIFLTNDSPEKHKFIGEKEKVYILEETKEIAEAHKEGENSAPWKAILTSKPAIALFIGHTCSNWGTYLFLTNIPTYMKEILKFDIKSNGGLSAIPYISFWLVIVLSSIIGDKLIQSKRIEKNTVRKIFNGLGFFVPMGAVIGLSFVTCVVPYAGVALLTLGLAFTGCGYGAGFLVNFNDISGSYSGIVFGISNTFATIPGIVAPYLVGLLTKHQKQEEWRTVFLITAAVYLIGAICLFLLNSTTLQPWASTHKTKNIEMHSKDEIESLKGKDNN